MQRMRYIGRNVMTHLLNLLPLELRKGRQGCLTVMEFMSSHDGVTPIKCHKWSTKVLKDQQRYFRWLNFPTKILRCCLSRIQPLPALYTWLLTRSRNLHELWYSSPPTMDLRWREPTMQIDVSRMKAAVSYWLCHDSISSTERILTMKKVAGRVENGEDQQGVEYTSTKDQPWSGVVQCKRRHIWYGHCSLWIRLDTKAIDVGSRKAQILWQYRPFDISRWHCTNFSYFLVCSWLLDNFHCYFLIKY